MSDTHPLGLFEGYGVELEYMIVDTESLSVRPIADELLRVSAGEYVSDVDHGEISWSNELVSHVIELKTSGPAVGFDGLPQAFQKEVVEINRLLRPLRACLMPSAMHPWMDPWEETKLWDREYSVVYETFDRIFGCQGHGWSNLQSVHLNLPFANDREFARLHAAIRLILPILPALAASSPYVDGRRAAQLDARLNYYRGNSRKIPSITGRVIPEPVYNQADYQATIFAKMFADIAPHDPEGILQHEWLNARGAIARFSRSTIEIRVLDVQECPLADLAVTAAIVAVLKALADEAWTSLANQQAWPVEPLETILLDTIRNADRAVINNPAYLRSFGLAGQDSCTAGELWQHLLADASQRLGPAAKPWHEPWQILTERGPLARRIIDALGPMADAPSRKQLAETYRRLCQCLAEGRMFVG